MIKFFQLRRPVITSDTDPDTALMLRFCQGDTDAFNLLVEKFKLPILNYINRLTGNSNEAEDLAQNVFVQVFKSAERYEPKAKFTTWLFTIARNLCLNEFRRRQRRGSQPLPEENLDEEEFQELNPELQTRSPAVEIQEKELHDYVLAAIQKLPENQRTAILLCRYEGLSYDEIAQVLQISMGATKSLLNRARETLKIELREFLRET